MEGHAGTLPLLPLLPLLLLLLLPPPPPQAASDSTARARSTRVALFPTERIIMERLSTTDLPKRVFGGNYVHSTRHRASAAASLSSKSFTNGLRICGIDAVIARATQP